MLRIWSRIEADNEPRKLPFILEDRQGMLDRGGGHKRLGNTLPSTNHGPHIVRKNIMLINLPAHLNPNFFLELGTVLGTELLLSHHYLSTYYPYFRSLGRGFAARVAVDNSPPSRPCGRMEIRLPLQQIGRFYTTVINSSTPV